MKLYVVSLLAVMAAASFLVSRIMSGRALREEGTPGYATDFSLQASRDGYINLRKTFERIALGLVALIVAYTFLADV